MTIQINMDEKKDNYFLYPFYLPTKLGKENKPTTTKSHGCSGRESNIFPLAGNIKLVSRMIEAIIFASNQPLRREGED